MIPRHAFRSVPRMPRAPTVDEEIRDALNCAEACRRWALSCNRLEDRIGLKRRENEALSNAIGWASR